MTTEHAPAVSWLIGKTTHARTLPFMHRFSYRTLSILIDVDRLDEAARQSRFFSIERFNLFSFFRRDVGAREDAPLRDWAEAAFAQADVALDGGRVMLICFPRVLGYVFNPISMWFGYGPDGELRGAIYEVHNTFGDAHAYVCPAGRGQEQRQSVDKIFHVSPFFPDQGQYRFSLRPPTDRYALSIAYSRDNAPTFFANHIATTRPLHNRSALSAFASQPFSTHKAIAGIHWEALRLWMKGARYHRRPKPPTLISVGVTRDQSMYA